MHVQKKRNKIETLSWTVSVCVKGAKQKSAYKLTKRKKTV